MSELDDLDFKAEIDQISKKIDAIVQTVEQFDPALQEKENTEQE